MSKSPSMKMSDQEASVMKLFTFSGKEDEFKIWAAKFKAIATMNGFKNILMGTMKVLDESQKLDPTADAEEIKAWKGNEKAYVQITLCMKDVVRFNIVETAITSDLPNGDSLLAWEQLHK